MESHTVWPLVSRFPHGASCVQGPPRCSECSASCLFLAVLCSALWLFGASCRHLCGRPAGVGGSCGREGATGQSVRGAPLWRGLSAPCSLDALGFSQVTPAKARLLGPLPPSPGPWGSLLGNSPGSSLRGEGGSQHQVPARAPFPLHVAPEMCVLPEADEEGVRGLYPMLLRALLHFLPRDLRPRRRGPHGAR